MAYNKSAKKGNIFLLTEKGYDVTPDRVKPEREIGRPVKGYEYNVPILWVKKGYVEEINEKRADNRLLRRRGLNGNGTY